MRIIKCSLLSGIRFNSCLLYRWQRKYALLLLGSNFVIFKQNYASSNAFCFYLVVCAKEEKKRKRRNGHAAKFLCSEPLQQSVYDPFLSQPLYTLALLIYIISNTEEGQRRTKLQTRLGRFYLFLRLSADCFSRSV